MSDHPPFADTGAPLLLFTAPTPNGRRVSIFLEELKALNTGFTYDYHALALSATGDQHQPWYLALNPDGKIPALIDRSRNNFTLSESSAILLYVQERYDPQGVFGFEKGGEEWFECMRWLFFMHGGLGPDAVTYFRLLRSGDASPSSLSLLKSQILHSFSVLNTRLNERDYLAGSGKGKYSIADINCVPFVAGHPILGVETLEDEWPHLNKWLERLMQRRAVKTGIAIP